MKDAASRIAVLASAPYVAWMLLMFALPAAGAGECAAYAVKTFAGAALLALFAVCAVRRYGLRAGLSLPGLAAGLAAGLAVAVLWIAPEYSEFYREWFATGSLPDPRASGDSPFAPENCGWPLTLVRLAGSAFVIAPAEELFFRWFLYRRLQSADWLSPSRRVFDMQAFLWTTALFALEHDRFAAGAAAGAVYLAVYLRRGVASAALAHSVTNLALGIWAIARCEWTFW